MQHAESRLTIAVRARTCLAVGAVLAAAAAAVPAAPARAARLRPGPARAAADAPRLRPGPAHVAWWRWALSMPLSTHPLNPASGSKCSTGQAGRVWFLGGVVNSGGTVTRRCRIPARTRLVVAVANVECSTLEPDPFGGSDAASLRACAHGVVVPNSRLFVKRRLATLDGRRLRLRRAPTRPFAFTVPGPSDNLLACAPMCRGTTGTAAADGYLVLLDPLPAGRHRLHLLGSFPAFRFVLNITYRLTVVGRRG